MTTTLTIVTVFPELFNVNGDSENALVLAQRARWAGHAATVIPLRLGDELPESAPDILVLGSSTDAALPEGLDALVRHRPTLARWLESGLPVVAVGTGWEILGESIELQDAVIPGLGLVPSRAVHASSRASDDLVVESRFGRLIGFENHARDTVLLAGAAPLGTVLAGRGNGTGSEGLVSGGVRATHLHGPVLAKNPRIADDLLAQALGDSYGPGCAVTIWADDMARAARNTIAARLGLDAR